MARCKKGLKGLAMCILDGGDRRRKRRGRVSMACKRHRGLFAQILSGGWHTRDTHPDIGGNKEEEGGSAAVRRWKSWSLRNEGAKVPTNP